MSTTSLATLVRELGRQLGWYLLVFATTAALVVWNTRERISEFTSRQAQASADATDGVARQIGDQLTLLRKAVQLFADRERTLLGRIAVAPSDGAAWQRLEERARNVFPEAFAVTLADPRGRVLHDDIEGLVGEVCQQDIVRFSGDPRAARPYLHPNPSGSHIDIMVPVALDRGAPWVFFVSFRVEMVARLLANAQIAGHELVLLRGDIPDLIEVTARGSRDMLARDVRLTRAERQFATRRAPVEGTTWEVADVVGGSVLAAYKRDRWLELGLILGSMVAIGGALLVNVLRQQRRVELANAANRQQAEELRRSEAQLRETNVLQRAIFDSANYTIISTDPDGIIRTFNAAAEQMLGYRADEVVGKVTPAIIHVPEEVVTRAAELTRELGRPVEPGFEVFVAKARGGQPDEREWTYVRKDGSRFPVLLSVTALHDAAGTTTGYLGIGSDITERRKIERLKNEFISTVSHELRTPLTSIRGSLGLVASGAAGEIPTRARELVDIAARNCERLTLLINDILDIEKIESGAMSFELVPQPLLSLVQQAIEMTRGFAESLGVRCVLRPSLPDARVHVDGTRLIQVITNLVSNAAKFSPTGREIEVSISRPHGMLRVSVADRGPGVPPEFRERIFQRFAQADASDSRRRGGTGLGLSISKAIVERFGGRIGFEARPGGGAIFYFDLPEWHGWGEAATG